jgi:hypothetical protein
MHTVTLQFKDPSKTPQFQDAITHAASIDLLLKGIHTSQNTHNTLILHDSKQLTHTLLLLSNSPLYDAVCASKTPK